MRQNKIPAVLQVILSICLVCGTVASAQVSPAKTHESHFSYSGDDGPGFWAKINPQWKACGNETQSPVDIPGNADVDPTLTLTLELEQTSAEMFNDGHTIKVGYTTGTPGPGGTITFNGVPYDIQQFHFHTLSEHTFQGHRGLMELHAVFKDRNTPANFVAIAMLYEIGNADPFLSKLISAGLPKKSHSKKVPIQGLDLANAFTEISSYYTYAGALTVPSCFPVTFIVLKTEATMSEGQFLAFQGIMGDNFRPIQALNGRVVRVTPSD
jgi:carbonic anhydrase